MPFLGLISPDQILCNAVGEQLKEDSAWQLALFASLEDALGVWGEVLPPILLWDAERAAANESMAAYFSFCLDRARPAPLLLVLGDVDASLQKLGVTERFSRPLRIGYLLSRLQFYQRVLSRAPDLKLSFGPWFFEPRARTLTSKDGARTIKLTDKESGLLEYLCLTPEGATREDLLASIWGYGDQIDTHTLETHIYRLRRRLAEESGSEEEIFLTENGGYRLNPAWLKT